MQNKRRLFKINMGIKYLSFSELDYFISDTQAMLALPFWTAWKDTPLVMTTFVQHCRVKADKGGRAVVQ